MRRHSPDLVGLIFGMAFVIAGVGFLVHETTDTVVNPAWATGLGLMLLGAIALVATIARGPRDERVHAAFPDAGIHPDIPTDTEPGEDVAAGVTSDE